MEYAIACQWRTKDLRTIVVQEAWRDYEVEFDHQAHTTFIQENKFENDIWKWWPFCFSLNAYNKFVNVNYKSTYHITKCNFMSILSHLGKINVS